MAGLKFSTALCIPRTNERQTIGSAETEYEHNICYIDQKDDENAFTSSFTFRHMLLSCMDEPI